MAKRLLQLSSDAVDALREQPETGMGFYVVKGHFPQAYVDSVFIVGGNHILVPLKHAEFFSIADLLDGLPLPQNAEAIAGFAVTSAAPTRNAASLPSGYKPAAGCVPLVGSLLLSEPTLLCRYLSTATDPRLSGSTLVKGTYLTTRLDLNDIRTGFAAVGRYSLPLPTPASNVFEYEIPGGTQLLINTVLPCFGQVGGGVEIRLAAPTPVTPRGQRQLSDI